MHPLFFQGFARQVNNFLPRKYDPSNDTLRFFDSLSRKSIDMSFVNKILSSIKSHEPFNLFIPDKYYNHGYLKVSLEVNLNESSLHLLCDERYISYHIKGYDTVKDLASFSHEDILVQGTDVETYFS